MRVFVKNQRGKPLMPCSNKKARLLLKENKAKIIKYNPFTIQLTHSTGETIQPINIGVDTGAKYIGIAITSQDKVLVKGEIELRQDVSKLISARKIIRRSRRNKNTRYRETRFLNRKHRDNWLPPSIQSRVDNTICWIEKFKSFVPNPIVIIEVGKFDVQKIICNNIVKQEYQCGNTYGYYNDRYYIFARDEYKCQICKGKSKDNKLRTHHIIHRSKGGSNRVDNQITVCETCHIGFHSGKIKHRFKKPMQYKEPAFMNVLRKRILNNIDCIPTYGNITVIDRQQLGLEKTHYNDAIAISRINKIKQNSNEYFYYKQFRKKKRSLHENIPRKGLKHKNITAKRNNKNVKYRNGTYLNDKFTYNGIIGWVYGFSAGERSYECLMRNIDGEIIKMPHRKSSLTVNTNDESVIFKCHNNGWQYAVLNKK